MSAHPWLSLQLHDCNSRWHLEARWVLKSQLKVCGKDKGERLGKQSRLDKTNNVKQFNSLYNMFFFFPHSIQAFIEGKSSISCIKRHTHIVPLSTLQQTPMLYFQTRSPSLINYNLSVTFNVHELKPKIHYFGAYRNSCAFVFQISTGILVTKDWEEVQCVTWVTLIPQGCPTANSSSTVGSPSGVHEAQWVNPPPLSKFNLI